MNTRDYKIFRPGHYYHIYNRGNNKQVIFRDNQDYCVFMDRLRQVLGIPTDQRVRLQPLTREAFSILSYVAMPNHFHFEIRQNSDIGINILMSKLSTSYAMYFNRKYGCVGHVFQDRFKAKLIPNEEYAKYLSAYIHNNPADLNFKFSSFNEIMGLTENPICDTKLLLSWFGNDPQAYKKFVQSYREDKSGIIDDLLFDE